MRRNPARTPQQKSVRQNTLAALTGIYSEDPYKSFEEAQKYAQQLVQDNPNDPKNLYALANLYEKFNKIPEAEEIYKKVSDIMNGEKIHIIEPTPEEREDNQFVDLPRIAFSFNRRDYGRLRQLIDVLNSL